MKKILVKINDSWEIIEKEINPDIQKNNSLKNRSIYLVEIDFGVIWGYDTDVYDLDDSSKIIKKQTNTSFVNHEA